ncbi:YbgA family protein, partial [Candidatus Bathyarchaeota archaeon]|nr:YbgA family protein [Candidatus Bathyarchaeota archaeon]
IARAHTPSVGSNINVMLKIMGYFSHQLSKDEKSFFLNSIDKYKAGRLPMSACLSILRAWIVRLKQEYLLSQTLLEPYPEQLSEPETVYSEIDGKNYLK